MSAFQSLMVNEVEEVMKALKIVREISDSVSKEELPTYVNALDLIAEFVHGIDVANGELFICGVIGHNLFVYLYKLWFQKDRIKRIVIVLIIKCC